MREIPYALEDSRTHVQRRGPESKVHFKKEREGGLLSIYPPTQPSWIHPATKHMTGGQKRGAADTWAASLLFFLSYSLQFISQLSEGKEEKKTGCRL